MHSCPLPRATGHRNARHHHAHSLIQVNGQVQYFTMSCGLSNKPAAMVCATMTRPNAAILLIPRCPNPTSQKIDMASNFGMNLAETNGRRTDVVSFHLMTIYTTAAQFRVKIGSRITSRWRTTRPTHQQRCCLNRLWAAKLAQPSCEVARKSQQLKKSRPSFCLHSRHHFVDPKHSTTDITRDRIASLVL
jgi:hypothetical protein